MWIVQLALRRPYTFVVAALALFLLGVVPISRMPTDIFPVIDIPVVSVIWSFTGVSPEEMEKCIVTASERAFTTTVNNIEHIESQSMQGVSVIKVFFQPGAKVEAAVAQKMGEREYSVRLNSSPEAVELLNDLPIRQINSAMVYIRDVAQVHDGFAVQTNIVNLDGRRASLISILKSRGASTLDVVNRVKEALPSIQAILPSELDLRFLFDESLFVRAAVDGVIKEAAIRPLPGAPQRPGLAGYHSSTTLSPALEAMRGEAGAHICCSADAMGQ
jgi:multidrug efflux pump subunit AcrB